MKKIALSFGLLGLVLLSFYFGRYTGIKISEDFSGLAGRGLIAVNSALALRQSAGILGNISEGNNGQAICDLNLMISGYLDVVGGCIEEARCERVLSSQIDVDELNQVIKGTPGYVYYHSGEICSK